MWPLPRHVKPNRVDAISKLEIHVISATISDNTFIMIPPYRLSISLDAQILIFHSYSVVEQRNIHCLIDSRSRYYVYDSTKILTFIN